VNVIHQEQKKTKRTEKEQKQAHYAFFDVHPQVTPLGIVSCITL
jgi:hypothetical protein